MKEIGYYKPIPGYNGLYEIDNFGNIRKILKTKVKIMTPVPKRGLLTIKLMTPSGSRKEERIHKLVQFTFLGVTPPGKVLFHKNGDKQDNCVANIGFIDRQKLGEITGHKSRQQAVLKIDAGGGVEKIYRSARAAGRDNHMSYQTITDYCNGKVKSRYAPDGYQYVWDKDYKY